MTDLADICRKTSTLYGAWQVVFRKGRVSSNSNVRADTANYAKRLPANLKRAQADLKRNDLVIQPGFGYVKVKDSGSKRPIVMFSTRDRVIQRAILDSIISVADSDSGGAGAILPRLYHDHSYGGVKGREVEDALLRAKALIGVGYSHYCRSDIKDFYTRVPRMLAIEELIRRRGDDSLLLAIERATTVSLTNAAELGRDIALFPDEERGIAQGNCLSPILGNVLLTDFDDLMNSGGVACLRFIDDFLLLGKSESDVLRMLEEGRTFLQSYGLDAYVPGDGRDKADQGKTSDRFEFLGCQVHYPRIIPDARSRKRLIDKIQKALDESACDMRGLLKGANWHARRRTALVPTLSHISDIVKAWAGVYDGFCDTKLVYPELDSQIDKLLKSYLGQYSDLRKKLPKRFRRAILGVPSLCDL